MANFIKKFLGSQKANLPDQPKELGKLNTYGNNLVPFPKSTEKPEHLVAFGRILSGGKQVSEIKTAINRKGDDVEFSTNLGQLPNTRLGGAIKESLSHRLDGKLVTFDNQQDPSKVGLVYATRKPYDWLNRERFDRELENHAKTKDLVNPVLSASINVGQPRKSLSAASVKEIADDIVDSNLGLHRRLNGKLGSSQYLPNPQDRKIK